MKTSQLFTAFNLTAAACMLPVLVLVGMESLAAPAQTAPPACWTAWSSTPSKTSHGARNR